ncbi:MAG: LytTR family DNA-binding domain-containing protein [Acidobacteriota bacterium]
MKILNILIVDDEFLARKELANRLYDYSGNYIIHQADSVDSAIDVLAKGKIDLIFLDIQLMGETGFDLLKRIKIKADVVFVTAYEEYALRAFEVNAVDYLLKPVNIKRFNITMERILSKKRQNVSKELTYSDQLIEKNFDGIRLIKLKNILYISAEGDYTRICCVEENDMLLYRTMKCWEDMLPQKYFRRIHRSTIINTEYIEKFHKTDNSKHLVEITGVDKIFTVSRTYLPNL